MIIIAARFPDGRVVRSNSKVGEVVWRDPVVHSEENVGNDIGAQLIRRGTVA
jgi:hypothetical protein